MIATILPLIIEILGAIPGTVASVREIWTLATQTEAPTPEQQAAFDAAVEDAHRRVQTD